MSKNQATNQPNPQKNDKFFSKDNLAGIIALVAVVLVALYVISTHLNLPVLIVPDDAVEMTYPASIFTVPVEEMADSMKGTDGVYRVKVNSDGSLSVKLSSERYERIKEAAKNAVESMMIVSIGENTAIRDYYATEDNTNLCITVNEEIKVYNKETGDFEGLSGETLAKEVSDAIYTARLYHICNMNLDAKIKLYYINETTEETYLCETYDIDGNVIGTATGALIPPERETVEPATE